MLLLLRRPRTESIGVVPCGRRYVRGEGGDKVGLVYQLRGRFTKRDVNSGGIEIMESRETQQHRHCAKLFGCVGEEADAASAAAAVPAHHRAVLRGVKPALEDAVGEPAQVAPGAPASAEGGAGEPGSVPVLDRIPTPRRLAGMNEGARRPVVDVRPRARQHLEAEHAELVGTVDAAVDSEVGKEGVDGVLPLLLLRHLQGRRKAKLAVVSGDDSIAQSSSDDAEGFDRGRGRRCLLSRARTTATSAAHVCAQGRPSTVPAIAVTVL